MTRTSDTECYSVINERRRVAVVLPGATNLERALVQLIKGSHELSERVAKRPGKNLFRRPVVSSGNRMHNHYADDSTAIAEILENGDSDEENDSFDIYAVVRKSVLALSE